MHLPFHESPLDPQTQRAHDRRRLRHAFVASLAFVLLLAAVYSAQGSFEINPWTVRPGIVAGLRGLLAGPVLHGSLEHLGANAVSLLMLGTLAGSVYPRAALRALPLLWLGSGLGAWLLGDAGTHHLGASGLTHGLMFLVFSLGLLRRDRPAIAAAMIAFFFYGGMLLTVLPQEPGVSWQSHLGGALAGIVAAWLFRRRDPLPPRKRYSWEIEDELEAQAARDEREQLEPPPPESVPVLWRRGEEQRREEPRGVVLRFPERHDR